MLKFLALFLSSFLIMVASAQASVAPTFEVTDLADAPGDPNRMMITYRFSGPLEAFSGVNFLFSAQLFSDLSADSTSDFLASVIQSDLAGPDGIVSLMALQDFDATPFAFDVQFTYLGSGTPGSQGFEFTNANFDLVASGSTVPFGVAAIPEPSTLLLLLPGLMMLGNYRRRC